MYVINYLFDFGCVMVLEKQEVIISLKRYM